MWNNATTYLDLGDDPPLSAIEVPVSNVLFKLYIDFMRSVVREMRLHLK